MFFTVQQGSIWSSGKNVQTNSIYSAVFIFIKNFSDKAELNIRHSWFDKGWNMKYEIIF